MLKHITLQTLLCRVYKTTASVHVKNIFLTLFAVIKDTAWRLTPQRVFKISVYFYHTFFTGTLGTEAIIVSSPKHQKVIFCYRP